MAIGRLAKAEDRTRTNSTMARKFIEERLEQYRIEKAIELYVNEKGNLKEISEITGVTVRMIMRTLRKKNTPLRMGEEVFDIGMVHARMVSRVLGWRRLRRSILCRVSRNVVLLIRLDRSTLAQTRA